MVARSVIPNPCKFDMQCTFGPNCSFYHGTINIPEVLGIIDENVVELTSEAFREIVDEEEVMEDIEEKSEKNIHGECQLY